nr:ATP-dependent Clp protease adapter ClpS [Asticcacaulis aquaticus]
MISTPDLPRPFPPAASLPIKAARAPKPPIEDSSKPANAPFAIIDAKPKPQKPSLYRVLILNDDYTPMEFVVYVLERFFNKSREEATHIMLHVHQTGVGVCGLYTYEVAETKVAQVVDMARRHQHPLQCTMEKD